MCLKNKRILITAGPTWVAIDSVRIISNIATGETGILIAEEAKQAGAKVTLVLGPTDACCLGPSIRVLRFRFFDEFKQILSQQLRLKYDVVIHSAAVADYRPRRAFKRKIDSRQKRMDLNLVAAPKLVNLFKKLNRSLFLVAFKFEPHLKGARLINKAKTLFKQANADLVVANTVENGHYRAYIVSREQVKGPVSSKIKLAEGLIRKIGEAYART